LLIEIPLVVEPEQRTGALSSLSMGVELYGSRNSRSPLVEWLLVEQNTPYKHREDRDGLPNPFGQIPALRDGDVEVFESGAILLYLAGAPAHRSTYVFIHLLLYLSIYLSNYLSIHPSLSLSLSLSLSPFFCV
jgi:hypothetical protein